MTLPISGLGVRLLLDVVEDSPELRAGMRDELMANPK